MKFGEFKIKLREEINKLRDHCKICEENYKEEYEAKLLEKEQKAKLLAKKGKGKKRKRDIETEICQHFIAGICAFGVKCKKIHDIREKLPRRSEN